MLPRHSFGILFFIIKTLYLTKRNKGFFHFLMQSGFTFRKRKERGNNSRSTRKQSQAFTFFHDLFLHSSLPFLLSLCATPATPYNICGINEISSLVEIGPPLPRWNWPLSYFLRLFAKFLSKLWRPFETILFPSPNHDVAWHPLPLKSVLLSLRFAFSATSFLLTLTYVHLIRAEQTLFL